MRFEGAALKFAAVVVYVVVEPEVLWVFACPSTRAMRETPP